MMPTIPERIIREDLTGILLAAPRSQAIGAALALLLDAVDKNPGQLQAVLHAKVDRVVGKQLRQAEIIDVLAAVARGY
jgi:hypothetical protein